MNLVIWDIESSSSSTDFGSIIEIGGILLDKNFEAEKPTSLEGLSDTTCRWPIGHPDEESFYFCGRKPIEDFPYCKLHVLYAFQPKNQKEDVLDKEDEIPEFIEKKVKSAS